MKKKLIIGNWKMNPSNIEGALSLASSVETASSTLRTVEAVIAIPFPFLPLVRGVIKRVRLGAQNMFWEGEGAYTGEVSWKMLKSVGVLHVILGHSERRNYFGETDAMINKKVLSALHHGFTAILCIGERERSDGNIPQVVGDQLERALAGVTPKYIKNLVVAYEPVWAISANKNAEADTPDNAFRAKLFIQKILIQRYGRTAADAVRIIYGGSVTSHNIKGFLEEGRMEGALVGGASLRLDDFEKILFASAKKHKQ